MLYRKRNPKFPHELLRSVKASSSEQLRRSTPAVWDAVLRNKTFLRQREKWSQYSFTSFGRFKKKNLFSDLQLERWRHREPAVTCFTEECQTLPFALAQRGVLVYQLILAVIIHGRTLGIRSLQEGRQQWGNTAPKQSQRVLLPHKCWVTLGSFYFSSGSIYNNGGLALCCWKAALTGGERKPI